MNRLKTWYEVNKYPPFVVHKNETRMQHPRLVLETEGGSKIRRAHV